MFLSPFLNTGTMCACNQSLGSLPCSKDVWNRKVIAGVSSSASSFKYLACMLSGPVAFVRMLCVFTNYKIIENIDFCSWRTYEKINKNVFNFILYSHSQLVTGARDPDVIATLSLSYFDVMT